MFVSSPSCLCITRFTRRSLGPPLLSIPSLSLCILTRSVLQCGVCIASRCRGCTSCLGFSDTHMGNKETRIKWVENIRTSPSKTTEDFHLRICVYFTHVAYFCRTGGTERQFPEPCPFRYVDPCTWQEGNFSRREHNIV